MSNAIPLGVLVDWTHRFRDAMVDQRDWLTELDSAIGDADHGANMSRGMTAVADKVDQMQPATADALFTTVGMTLVSTVGGASGPLYGTFFLRLGAALGPVTEVDPSVFADGLRAGLGGVVARGKAEAGDKTMVDAIAPALAALEAAVAEGVTPVEATSAAADAAAEGRDATIPLVARKGRASYLGERSAGHRDPGSASATLMFETLAAAVAGAAGGSAAVAGAGFGAAAGAVTESPAGDGVASGSATEAGSVTAAAAAAGDGA